MRACQAQPPLLGVVAPPRLSPLALELMQQCNLRQTRRPLPPAPLSLPQVDSDSGLTTVVTMNSCYDCLACTEACVCHDSMRVSASAQMQKRVSLLWDWGGQTRALAACVQAAIPLCA